MLIIGAMMRKLIHAAFGVLNSGVPFRPELHLGVDWRSQYLPGCQQAEQTLRLLAWHTHHPPLPGHQQAEQMLRLLRDTPSSAPAGAPSPARGEGKAAAEGKLR
ncbi:MAG: hypothetical protein LBU43_11375, partial [Candidatus Accumulibacter sp.]|nr:hypothetical protein [Accumulibacter sp.]